MAVSNINYHRKNRKLSPHTALTLNSAAVFIEALATAGYQLSMPADPVNAVFLGYSYRRLAVIGLVLAAAAIMFMLTLKARRDAKWATTIVDRVTHNNSIFRVITITLGILSLGGWILSWTPPYRFQPYDLIFKGLHPIIVLLTIAGFQSVILLIALKFGIQWGRIKNILISQKFILINSLLVFGAILITWLFTALTRIGLTPDIAYWNEAGVPVLSAQVLLAWLVGFGFFILLGSSDKKQPDAGSGQQESSGINIANRFARFDMLVFLIIWLIAGVIWVSEPQVRSFFAPGPYPPNNEFYPISDAAGYDIAAQFALIGQELDNGHHVDKPLYSTFLFFMHLLAGQDFNLLVILQTIILATLPAILYLIGKELHSRTAGIIISL